jgi:hypothetical protein
MITLFDERDLISFGMYMISEQRKESIKNNPEITNNETRKAILKTVTQFDFNNWLRYRIKAEQAEQAEQEALEDSTPITQDEMEEAPSPENTEDNSKTIKLNSEV